MNVRRNWRPRLAAVALGALSAVPAARAADLQPADGPTSLRRGWTEVVCMPAVAAPAGLKPAPRSTQAVRLSLPLGNRSAGGLAGLLDESGGSGTGFDTLYLDANGNGNLADDPVLHPPQVREGATLSLALEPVTLALPYRDGSTRALKVGLQLRGYRDEAAGATAWSASCYLDQHLEGRADFGARRNMRIALYDCARGAQPGNGCFDDWGADRLQLDLDGDGRFDAAREDLPLSRVVAVDGALWALQVDSAGRGITVAPYAGPAGTLRADLRLPLGTRVVAGRLEWDGGDGCAVACDLPAGAAWRVPAGEYALAAGSFDCVGPTGKTWSASFALERRVTVPAGGSATVALGAPLRAGAKLARAAVRGGSACIEPHILGVGGEVYENIAPLQTRMTPRMVIRDAEGIVAAQGQMDYG